MTKILYVEDELFLAGVLAQFLTKAGFSLDIAKDGEEGLKKAAENHPDVILLDLILPKTDGFEVLRQLKANPQTASIAVAILSNLGTDQDRIKAQELGAEAYFVKAALSPEEVVERIRNFIDGRLVV